MEIKQLIDDYIHWLKKEITFEKIGEYYEITTPFLNSANDFIQIYVRIDKDTIFFTDDGYTLNQLYMNGFQLTSTRKDTLFSFILLIRHKEYQTKERKISHEKKDMEYRNSSYAGCWLWLNEREG